MGFESACFAIGTIRTTYFVGEANLFQERSDYISQSLFQVNLAARNQTPKYPNIYNINEYHTGFRTFNGCLAGSGLIASFCFRDRRNGFICCSRKPLG